MPCSCIERTVQDLHFWIFGRHHDACPQHDRRRCKDNLRPVFDRLLDLADLFFQRVRVKIRFRIHFLRHEVLDILLALEMKLCPSRAHFIFHINKTNIDFWFEQDPFSVPYRGAGFRSSLLVFWKSAQIRLDAKQFFFKLEPAFSVKPSSPYVSKYKRNASPTLKCIPSSLI